MLYSVHCAMPMSMLLLHSDEFFDHTVDPNGRHSMSRRRCQSTERTQNIPKICTEGFPSSYSPCKPA